MANRNGSELKALIRESVTNKQPFKMEWDVCRHYLRGRQYLSFDRIRQEFAPVTRQKLKDRVVTNRILPHYRTVVSKLQVVYPSIGIAPSSPSLEDIKKARLNEYLVQYYWGLEDLKYVIGDFIDWLTLTGTSGLMGYYDPELKRVMPRAISPYDLFFEANASSVDETQFIAVRSFVLRSDLEDAYEEHAEKIKTVSAAGNENNQGGFDDNPQPKDRIEIFEMYFKDGSVYVLMDSEVLFKDKMPEEIIPIAIATYTDIPGEIWGMGLVAPLIGLQDQYNEFRTQQKKAIRLCTNPKVLMNRAGNVSAQSFTDREGEKIYYDAGGKPEYMALNHLPTDVDNNLTKLEIEMNDVSGVQQTTLGKAAGGVTSGVAIQALAEKSASQLSMTQQNIERAVAVHAKHVLVLMKAFYTSEVMVKMLDGLGNIIHNTLSNTDIMDAPEITIEAGSLFRNEIQDRDNKVLQLMQMEMIDKETAMKELSFKTGNRYLMEKMMAVAHAQEILEVAKVAPISGIEGVLPGQGIETIKIKPTDDLKAFKEVFSEFCKSPEFYQLSIERQDFIDTILDSILTFGQPVEQFQKQRQELVYPRQTRDPEELVGQIAAVDDIASAQQMTDATREMMMRGSQIEAVEQGAQNSVSVTPQDLG